MKNKIWYRFGINPISGAVYSNGTRLRAQLKYHGLLINEECLQSWAAIGQLCTMRSRDFAPTSYITKEEWLRRADNTGGGQRVPVGQLVAHRGQLYRMTPSPVPVPDQHNVVLRTRRNAFDVEQSPDYIFTGHGIDMPLTVMVDKIRYTEADMIAALAYGRLSKGNKFINRCAPHTLYNLATRPPADAPVFEREPVREWVRPVPHIGNVICDGVLYYFADTITEHEPLGELDFAYKL